MPDSPVQRTVHSILSSFGYWFDPERFGFPGSIPTCSAHSGLQAKIAKLRRHGAMPHEIPATPLCFTMPVEFPASPCSLWGSGSNHIRSGSIRATTIVAVLALRIHGEDNVAVKTLSERIAVGSFVALQ
jgi:hypothetical protein